MFQLMRAATWLWAIAAALTVTPASGCKSKKKDAERSDEAERGAVFGHANADQGLWSWAPNNTLFAVVVADGALASGQSAAQVLLRGLSKVDGSDSVTNALRSLLTLRGVDLTGRSAAGELGIDLTMGLAYFLGSDFEVFVLPCSAGARLADLLVGDQDAGSNSASNLRCSAVRGRVTCARGRHSVLENIDVNGVSAALAGLGADRARGQVELLVAEELWTEVVGLSGRPGSGSVWAAVELESGGATLKLEMPGRLALPAAAVSGPGQQLATRLLKMPAVGFVRMELSGLWGQYKLLVSTELKPMTLVPGVSLGELLRGFSGEVVGYALGGRPWSGGVLLGLTDAGPLSALVNKCDDITALPGLSAKVEGSAGGVDSPADADARCLVTLDTGGPAAVQVNAEVWVHDSVGHIRLGADRSAAPMGSGPSGFAGDLLSGRWTVAAWGLGSIFDLLADADEAAWKIIASVPEARMALWALLHVAEVGVAIELADNRTRLAARVRTTWSYSRELAEELEPIILRAVAGDRTVARDLEGMLDRSSESPFASDYRAGAAGIMAPAAAVGLFAGVAVPAVLRYTAGFDTDAGTKRQ